jgi:hypothetical protein
VNSATQSTSVKVGTIMTVPIAEATSVGSTPLPKLRAIVSMGSSVRKRPID